MADDTPNMEELVLVDEPEFERVMECVFGIREHESRTYFTLIELPGSTVLELAEELDRDRSNVNRSLSTLHEKGLIEREQRLLDGGGYVYQYFPASPSETKKRMHRSVDAWCQRVHDQIEEFGP